MKKEDKDKNGVKIRSDRGTYKKEKDAERNRWKQNLKNYANSKDVDEIDDDDFEE